MSVSIRSTEQRAAVALAVEVSELGYGAGAHLARARDVYRDLYPGHDGERDRRVRAIEAINAPLVNHPDPVVSRAARETLASCAGYWRHDELADAVPATMDGHVSHAQVGVRAINAVCDEAETGHRRGRLRRAMTRADQPSLLDVHACDPETVHPLTPNCEARP